MSFFLGRLAVWALALFLGITVRSPAAEIARHGIAMHGEPALPAGFDHLPYADPHAPRRGRITLAQQGTFDSLNPLIVIGVAPDVVPRYVLQSLMVRSLDEPFTVYGLVARSAEMPEDRSFITFNLDPRARFSDDAPLTAEDVRFTFELLREHGKPFYRSSFASVRGVEVENPHRIRFDLSGSGDRELPLIIAMMPILPAHATDPEMFTRTTFTAPIGSGPYVVSEVRPGERIALTRRPDYWGSDLPVHRGIFNFDEIRYDFYRDENTLFEAFKVGLYDFRLENDPGRWVTGYDFPAVLDGRIRRDSLPIRTPQGMNGFVLNARRPALADVRVREALGMLFDFDWVNRNLYHGVMRRSTSFFAGSELSAYGVPADDEERALLAPFPGAVREDILEGRWSPPSSDGSGRDRELARSALDLLSAAGYVLDGATLRNQDTGEALSLEFLVNSRQQERLALNFAHGLRRVGIDLRVRPVDDVQFWRRLGRFEFDIIQWTWPASPSPGNEQRNRWSSTAALRDGSLNFAGVQSPAADRLIDALLEAASRNKFVSAVRALDRVLLSGFHVVPLFYRPEQWVAFDATLGQPETVPLFGANIDTWWRPPSGQGTSAAIDHSDHRLQEPRQ
ncbi:extracellular solute-binding protein [Microvirga massiliensis]|uniref:extracellular solute-binding protein n=1 Tax=Microvirga massiliensis TaxID=1033741 RepID=UPI0009E50437|nr:extracellular solute-binding protein [Microvirga massiliensis]